MDLVRRDFSIRALTVRVLGLGLFFLLLAVLFKTQLIEGFYFRELSEGNRIRQVQLPAPRGIIYDREGKALVSNGPAYRLVKCKDKGRKCTGNTISREQAIELQAKGLPPEADLVVDSSRVYLNGKEMAHLIGYVSEVSQSELAHLSGYVPGDKTGRGGVEESYEQVLRGDRGRELVEVDAAGNRLKVLSVVDAKPGRNLKLTIDLALQQKVYDLIKDYGGGAAVIVANPKTGELLALASSPSFDPNLFTDFTVDSDNRIGIIKELFLNTSQPLFNRTISGTYPPGSTFKIITATAGLENKKIDQNYLLEDTGVIVIGPYKFANWKYLQDGGTQGILNIVSALKVSNDIFFYQLGEKVGLAGLVSWMQKFGLGQRTGVDLPGEAKGVVPTKAWRQEFAPEWFLGDTFHLAIGQGKLLVTPLQMNVWTNVIANNGKLCKPHVAGETECKDLGISKKTINLIRQGLVEACSLGGTAWPLFNFNPQIACKTGTAEFGDPENRTHAWLTAYVPADNPEISVTVLVEAGGEGSDVAAPIVKKILESYLEQSDR